MSAEMEEMVAVVNKYAGRVIRVGHTYYIKPNIPDEVVKKLIKNFDSNLPINSLVAFLDSSVAWPCESGLLFTVNGFYHKFCRNPVYIAYQDITNMQIDGDYLSVSYLDNRELQGHVTSYTIIDSFVANPLQEMITELLSNNKLFNRESEHMKKVTCKNCGEYWIVEESKTDKLQVCPFCGVSLWEKAIACDLDNTTIENALFNIIRHSGIDVLKQESRVIGMLSDLTRGMDREVRIISRIYSQNTANMVYDAFVSAESSSQAKLIKVKRFLMEDEGFADSWATYFIESIQKCIQLYHEAEHKKQNVIVHEFIIPTPQSEIPTLSPKLGKTETGKFSSPSKSAESVPTVCTNSNKTSINSQSKSIPQTLTKSIENNGKVLRISSNSYDTSWRQKEIIEKVIIEEGVTETAARAFDYCKNLKEVVLPSTLTRIGFASFENCENLTTINFPSGLKTIAGKAFHKCHNLQNIALPLTVKYIGDDAFSGYNGNELYVSQTCVVCPGNYKVKEK